VNVLSDNDGRTIGVWAQTSPETVRCQTDTWRPVFPNRGRMNVPMGAQLRDELPPVTCRPIHTSWLCECGPRIKLTRKESGQNQPLLADFLSSPAEGQRWAKGDNLMNSFQWSLFYIGIVFCLLWIMRSLARIEEHLAAMRRDKEQEDGGQSPQE
jgi:hypothetical protein